MRAAIRCSILFLLKCLCFEVTQQCTKLEHGDQMVRFILMAFILNRSFKAEVAIERLHIEQEGAGRLPANQIFVGTCHQRDTGLATSAVYEGGHVAHLQVIKAVTHFKFRPGRIAE